MRELHQDGHKECTSFEERSAKGFVSCGVKVEAVTSSKRGKITTTKKARDLCGKDAYFQCWSAAHGGRNADLVRLCKNCAEEFRAVCTSHVVDKKDGICSQPKRKEKVKV